MFTITRKEQKQAGATLHLSQAAMCGSLAWAEASTLGERAASVVQTVPTACSPKVLCSAPACLAAVSCLGRWSLFCLLHSRAPLGFAGLRELPGLLWHGFLATNHPLLLVLEMIVGRVSS
jgi:hypothetical protein